MMCEEKGGQDEEKPPNNKKKFPQFRKEGKNRSFLFFTRNNQRPICQNSHLLQLSQPPPSEFMGKEIMIPPMTSPIR